MQKYPGIKISLTEKNSSECIQLLQEGTLELCFLTRQEYPVDITYEFLLHQKILLAIPPGHPIIERLVPGGLYSILPDSDIHRLNKEPFFLLPEYLHMGALTRNFLHSYNVTPKIVMETTAVQTAYRLTAQKMGFSFVSEITLKNVQFRTPPILAQLGSVGLSRFLVAAYRKDVYLPSATSWLIKRAKEVGQSFPIAPYDGIYG